MTEPLWPATRETDAAVARVLGGENVHEHTVEWADEPVWFGVYPNEPHNRGHGIPIHRYATADEYDSASWGETAGYLTNHTAWWQLCYADGQWFVRWGMSAHEVTREDGATPGHALACAVLSVDARLREE